jgi:hypothetical protein
MAEASRSFDDDLVGLFDLSHDAFCIAGFDGYLKRANPAFARSDIAGFECREVCADGSVRWFEWSTSGRPDDGVVYGVARDVTERRMANQHLAVEAIECAESKVSVPRKRDLSTWDWLARVGGLGPISRS